MAADYAEVDLDPGQLKVLRSALTPFDLQQLYKALINEIESWLELPGPALSIEQAHAQRGAALSLGALRLAGILHTIETQALASHRIAPSLRDAVSDLIRELNRNDLILRD